MRCAACRVEDGVGTADVLVEERHGPQRLERVERVAFSESEAHSLLFPRTIIAVLDALLLWLRLALSALCHILGLI